MGLTIDDLMAAPLFGANRHILEYDELVYAIPRNLTKEDLSANHAAGLPLLRERVVRCKDCKFYQRNSRCGGALQCLNERFSYGKWGATVEPDFFCADGKPREDD